MNEYLDAAGYPTVQALILLSELEPQDAIELLQEVWHPMYGDVTQDISPAELAIVTPRWSDEPATYLRLATGGWSGNEEAWEAFTTNSLAYALTWRLSAQGGLHILKLP